MKHFRKSFQAVSLAGFLVKHPDVVNKKRIIELGAGTGLAGIVAAKLGEWTVAASTFLFFLDFP